MVCIMLMGCFSMVTLAETTSFSEIESNDTANTATVIANGKIIGSMGTKTDVDWYKFEATEDYFEVDFGVNVEHIGVPLTRGWKISIYDNKMNLIQEYSDYTEFKGDKQAFSGTIYIKVCANDSYYDTLNNINYDITVTNTVNPNWEDEYNNDSQKAQSINAGEKYTGSLYTNKDADWYKLTSIDYLNITFSINMEYATSMPTKDWNVTVYDCNLTQIHSFDAANTHTTVNLPFSGMVFVKVSAADDYYSALNNVYYDITVNTATDALWESEYNDTSATANEINQGSKYSGNLYKKSDMDFYKFKSTTNAFKISFDIDLNEVSVDDIADGWKISVFPVDSASAIANYSVSSVGSFKTQTLNYPKGKEYFIKVEAVSSAFNNAPVYQTYHITVEDATDGKNWEVENGGTDFKYATAVADSKLYYGNLCYKSDADYFKYSVSAAGKVKIDFSRIDSELDGNGFKYELKKSSGVTVVSKSVNDMTSDSSTVTLAKGTYYLVVSAVSSAFNNAPDSSVDYNVKFTYLTLSTPTLSTVAQNGAKTLKVTWKKSADVTGYEIRYSTSKNFASAKTVTIKSNGTVSYNIKNLAVGKVYYVSIRTYKSMNGKTYYSAWTGSKANGVFNTPVISKVAQSGAKALKATWKKDTTVTGYEIKYSTSKSFASAKTVKVSSNKTVTYTIKNLAAKKTYYVSVRTYKTVDGKTYYSAWSTAKNAKTK